MPQHEWMMGYQKGAADKRPGVSRDQWKEAEAELGHGSPDELRALYGLMNGAHFPSGLWLHPLRTENGEVGVVETSRVPAADLASRTWRFGEMNGKHLFATTRENAAALVDKHAVDEVEWLEDLADEGWAFGILGHGGVLELFPTLEATLAALIPPTQLEEFGEKTYARAMSVVQLALDELEDDDDAEPTPEISEAHAVSEKAERRPAKKKPTRQKVAAKARRAPAKKKPAARKAAKSKSSMKKKPAARMGAKAKAPMKKKPAPKKKPARQISRKPAKAAKKKVRR